MLRSLILALASVGIAGAALAGPEGTWLTEGGKSHVEIRLCGDEYCGRLVWLREPNNEDGSVKLDENNKDEALRSRTIVGIELLTGFAAGGDGPWKGGRIYNPENGKTYRSNLRLKDAGTLRVSGCVFIFCETQIWTRAE